jgi:hypothetical protein
MAEDENEGSKFLFWFKGSTECSSDRVLVKQDMDDSVMAIILCCLFFIRTIYRNLPQRFKKYFQPETD